MSVFLQVSQFQRDKTSLQTMQQTQGGAAAAAVVWAPPRPFVQHHRRQAAPLEGRFHPPQLQPLIQQSVVQCDNQLSLTERLQEKLIELGITKHLPFFSADDINLDPDVEDAKKIGQGASGSVFKVDFNGVPSALKVLKASSDADIVNITGEVMTLIKLNASPHPGLLKVLGVGIREGCDISIPPRVPELLVATELHTAGSLFDVLKMVAAGLPVFLSGGLLTEQHAFGMCVDMLNALQHFHTQTQMVHLDLKPGNMFISSSGHVVIGDFGWAKTKESLVQPNFFITSTRGYMAPEAELVSANALSQATDVYSAGVVVSELLSLGAKRQMIFEWEAKRAFENRHGDRLNRLVQNGTITSGYGEDIRGVAVRNRMWPPPQPKTPCVQLEALLKAMLCPEPQYRPSARDAAVQLTSIARLRWSSWTAQSVRRRDWIDTQTSSGA